MNGVAAVVQLLKADTGVTALVPSPRIMAGVLPLGSALPSIAVTPVSGTDMQTHDEPGQRFVTDRVQVTVLAASYPELEAVMSVVKRAGDAKRPDVSGIFNVVVRTDGQGPWFMNEAASIHLRTQDFKVSYSADA